MPIGRGLPTRKTAPVAALGGGADNSSSSSGGKSSSANKRSGGTTTTNPSSSSTNTSSSITGSRRRTRGLPLTGGGNTSTSESAAVHPSSTGIGTASLSFATTGIATTASSPGATSLPPPPSRRRPALLPSVSKKRKNRKISSATIPAAAAAATAPTAKNVSSLSSSSYAAGAAATTASRPVLRKQQQQHPRRQLLLQAVLNDRDGGNFIGSKNRNINNSSLTWNVNVIVNGKQYDPNSTKSTGSSISSNSSNTSRRQQQQPNRPKRWSFTNDDTTEDAAEMLGTIDSDNEEATDNFSKNKNTPDTGVVSSTIIVPSHKQPRTPSLTKKIIGQDGNFHFCTSCGETGEVVCCDGCPHVYHPQCLPEDCESFAALDDQDDDEPWYCPLCIKNGTKKKRGILLKQKQAGNSKKGKKRTNKKGATTSSAAAETLVSPYRQNRPKRKRSYDADDFVYEGDARYNDDHEMLVDDDGDPVAIAVNDDDEETDITEAMAVSSSHPLPPDTPPMPASNNGAYTPSSKNQSFATPSRLAASSATKKGGGGAASSMKKKSKKKLRTGGGSRPDSPVRSSSPRPTTPKDSVPSSKKKDRKKKKKKKKKHLDGADNSSPIPSTEVSGSGGSEDQDNDNDGDNHNDNDDNNDDGGMLASLLRANSSGNVVKAVPAFYFFLNASRNRIDRSLSRKHRYFNRLPKSNMERNQLIAKEGISIWSKMTEDEIKQYVDVSMKDFERRIIEWKQEKTLRNMMNTTSNDGSGTCTVAPGNVTDDSQVVFEDDRLTIKNHNRLYLTTNVGYKHYKPDMEESNNRMLLELLQDMRFHPMPLLQANRSLREYGEMDLDRITIPYFDVNGPVSTCLGDECFGCQRGWTHFCNVLKRRVPAVPRRAKLQPPLSSLIATRVGLGMIERRLKEIDENGIAIDRNTIIGKSINVNDSGKNETGHGYIKKNNTTAAAATNTATTTKGETNGTKNTSGMTKINVGSGNVATFSTRDIPAAEEAKKLPTYPWNSLTAPTERADDIVRFIEEAICMKIPEPTRPKGAGMNISNIDADSNEMSNNLVSALASYPMPNKAGSTTAISKMKKLNLPLRERKRGVDEYGLVTEEDGENDFIVNKCGRCRTIIDGDNGCVPCRRAQLVINLSRGDAEGEEPKFIRVQTNMLGRILMRDADVDAQTEGDENIANHILRQRWNPFAVLPPKKVPAPHPTIEKRSKEKSNGNNFDIVNKNGNDAATLGEDDINTEKGVENEEKPKEEKGDDAADAMEIDILETPLRPPNWEETSPFPAGGSSFKETANSKTRIAPDKETTVNTEESSTFNISSGTDDCPTAGNVRHGPPSKRQRAGVRSSSRIVALENVSNTGTNATSSTSAERQDGNDRNAIGKSFKDEATVVHRKCVSIACLGLLLALMRRDPLLLFASPPLEVEGYTKIIKEPMDFGTIKKRVLQNKYTTLGSFVSDVKLLCDNAMIYNPSESIYWKIAKELSDLLVIMKDRASTWISIIKEEHASSFKYIFNTKPDAAEEVGEGKNNNANDDSMAYLAGDPFRRLRKVWPQAMEIYDNNEWLRTAIETDFMRTKENETAYYGCLAIRRAAMASAVSLAPYTDTGGIFNTVGRRTHEEDENLRDFIAKKVAETVKPPELKEIPSWREEMIMRVLRKSQARRMDGRLVSEHGCARCDGAKSDSAKTNKIMNAAKAPRWGKTRKKSSEVPRIHKSRKLLTTGLASQRLKERIKQHKKSNIRKGLVKGKIRALVAAADNLKEVSVTCRGSRIHGMGLFGKFLLYTVWIYYLLFIIYILKTYLSMRSFPPFFPCNTKADQPFQKGDVVAEYVGEYVTPAVTNARDKIYQNERIQDYQFRIDSEIVIDATKRGGHGRYGNHNCDPSCETKIVPFKLPERSPNTSTSSVSATKLLLGSKATAATTTTTTTTTTTQGTAAAMETTMKTDRGGMSSTAGDDNDNNNSNNSMNNSTTMLKRRVVVVARRDIDPSEELTYDYQFPLEVDLDERIPCYCNAKNCRGFMNWDLPEKGSQTSMHIKGATQKRGANMRDRIRRLGRPLKSDK